MIGFFTLRSSFFTCSKSAVALDSSQFLGKGFKFLDGELGKYFAADARILAEIIDALPVLGIDAKLLHQVKADAAVALALVSIAHHALDRLAERRVFARLHLVQVLGASSCILGDESRLCILVSAVLGQLVERGVETVVVLN